MQFEVSAIFLKVLSNQIQSHFKKQHFLMIRFLVCLVFFRITFFFNVDSIFFFNLCVFI